MSVVRPGGEGEGDRRADDEEDELGLMDDVVCDCSMTNCNYFGRKMKNYCSSKSRFGYYYSQWCV